MSESELFLDELAVYHKARGTELQRDPKVGARQIDLRDLYNTVVDRGGYDKVSNEKLAWTKLATELDLGSQNGFILKTVYYKNLAAFEITQIHKKEPPPKEILEDLTARGGSLLTRTLENYKVPRGNEAGMEDASGDDGTPARERNVSEETPGSGGRATRGLRQAPPQRVLFQPDASSSRQTRNVTASSHSSTPQHQSQQHNQRSTSGYHASANMENEMATVRNYEPTTTHNPLTMRQVITPGNNPAEFTKLQKAIKERDLQKLGKPAQPPAQGFMLPGTEYNGPNIYVRCLYSLKSGIPEEQQYALHHLVKISMERGDKFKFESFGGLAEALIHKVLEVGSLFYQVDWQVCYWDDGSGVMDEPGTLDGMDGTPDILERILGLTKFNFDDNIQTAEFRDHLRLVKEAALTMRNMVILPENARYVSTLAPIRDCLCIVLNLPNYECLVELKNYALDIAEEITRYLPSDENDPLFRSLLVQLHSEDRGAILASLRALCRISMELEENNLLLGVPDATIQLIMDWTLVNDEELLHGSLDFLYQYTAVVENVNTLITRLAPEGLVNQLVRLLSHGAKTVETIREITPDRKILAPKELATLPKDLFALLLTMDEPERSSCWLRSLFEEDPDEAITQIFLWTSYQNRFANHAREVNRQMLVAADFIKNVTTTFGEKVAAYVEPGIEPGDPPKYSIKGIRMRSIPVDIKGEEYHKCYWRTLPSHGPPCGEFYMKSEKLYNHILLDHLGASYRDDGQFDNSGVGSYSCKWDTCRKFEGEPVTKLSHIARHIKTAHTPPPRTAATTSQRKKLPSYIIPGEKQILIHVETANENGEAAGIPYTSVLILRNLALTLPKTDVEVAALKEEDPISWVDVLFKAVMPRLWDILANNPILVKPISDLIIAIENH